MREFINLFENTDTSFAPNREGLDELSRPDIENAETMLLTHGYERMGKGSYGTIWGKPGSQTVLKLFRNGDTAYPDFVRLAMSHPNPHFPKFHGKILRLNDKWSAIRMERLTPAVGTNALKADLIDLYVDRKGRQESTMSDYWNEIMVFFEDQPGLREACDLIISVLGDKHENDIWTDNVMYRGSTAVIIDPVAPKGWRINR
jgi:hypothetical protein